MLQTSTLRFLDDLRKNNNRPWFDAHKERYLEAKADFDTLVQQVIDNFGKTDPDIGRLNVKDCVYRIYRDVRFSKNKLPYKTHFAASFAKGGKKGHRPGYYFHIQPGGLSFCGAGLWRPEVEDLKSLRQEIDYNFPEFLSILNATTFKKRFKEFDQEDKLSRAPQGYEDTNAAIEYLKLKSFTTGRNIPDKDLTSNNLVKKIISDFTALKRLVDFISRATE